MKKFLVQTFVAGVLLFVPVFFLAFFLVKDVRERDALAPRSLLKVL